MRDIWSIILNHLQTCKSQIGRTKPKIKQILCNVVWSLAHENVLDYMFSVTRIFHVYKGFLYKHKTFSWDQGAHAHMHPHNPTIKIMMKSFLAKKKFKNKMENGRNSWHTHTTIWRKRLLLFPWRARCCKQNHILSQCNFCCCCFVCLFFFSFVIVNFKVFLKKRISFQHSSIYMVAIDTVQCKTKV